MKSCARPRGNPPLKSRTPSRRVASSPRRFSVPKESAKLPTAMQVEARARPLVNRRAFGVIRRERGAQEPLVGGYVEDDLWLLFSFAINGGLTEEERRRIIKFLSRKTRGSGLAQWGNHPGIVCFWDAGIAKGDYNRCQANGSVEDGYLVVDNIDTACYARRRGLATRLLTAVGNRTGLWPVPDIIGGSECIDGAIAFWRKFLGPSLGGVIGKKTTLGVPYLEALKKLQRRQPTRVARMLQWR
jgi:hypothetical protein